MDEATALARLERLVAADQDPTLDTTDVWDILQSSAIVDRAGNRPTNTSTAGAWVASTAVLAGTVVRVASSPARYWKCAVTGITAATVPSWPDLAGLVATGSTVFDGSVRWVDNGGEWSPTWNLEGAAADGWRTKAGKAAGRFDVGEDGQQFTRSQVIAHCNAMASRFENRNGGSVRISR